MASRSASVPSKNFYIPQLNIQANNSQLKDLQRRMLANHYQKQIHDRQLTARPQIKNVYNPENMAVETYRDINQMQSDLERSAKMQLAKDYQYEMNRKQQLKRQQRNRRLLDQNYRLKALEGIQQEQLSRVRKNQQLYKQDTRTMLQEANIRRKQRQLQKQKEKEEFNRRYSTNNIRAGKQSFFKEYYNNVSEAQKQIQRNYMQKWQPQILQRQQQRNKIIQSPYKNQQLLRKKLQIHNQQELKMKNDWKQILQEQIRQKSAKNQAEKLQKYSRYIDNKYQNVHHPINNPVDFKITHDNKYIMKELQKQRDGQYGTLARSGSQSIFN